MPLGNFFLVAIQDQDGGGGGGGGSNSWGYEVYLTPAEKISHMMSLF